MVASLRAARTLPPARSGTVAAGLLALMMVLVPALGVPGETLLQDTLKSTLVALFALAAALAWLLLRGSGCTRCCACRSG